MQMFTKRNGDTVGGIVLEETGRSIRLSPAAGQVIDVPKSEIVKREGTKISTMPNTFPSFKGAATADRTLTWCTNLRVHCWKTAILGPMP